SHTSSPSLPDALPISRQGFSFKLPLADYETFANSFGFEETVDQAAAIEAVLSDMVSGRPMDRLVCGDVGFGKTEVALRAAFMARSEEHTSELQSRENL